MNRIKLRQWLLLSFSLTIVPMIFLTANRASADIVRQPVRAGSFYPADPSELTRMIDRLTQKARKTKVRLPRDKALKALIMPHAGYVYSGWTAAHAALVLGKNRFSRVILMGPDHRLGIQNGVICNVDAYRTPLGRIDLHPDTKQLLRLATLFRSLPVSMDREHSLEVILPFLQTYLGKFELVPIIVGHTDVSSVTEALNALMDPDTLLVVSSDLSHFLDYSDALAMDRETVSAIMDMNAPMLTGKPNRACGLWPLLILMALAKKNQWQPVLLHYSNSGDTAGGRSRVVGYTTIAFFGDQPMDNKPDPQARFTEEQGQTLVSLARHTISEKLGRNLSDAQSAEKPPVLQDEDFKKHCGTFVTLKIKGQLRGCIGSLSSAESVWEGVRRNAINAAFHDPRFSPLTAHEFDKAEIEVSILTEPRLLEYRDGEDLIQKLRVNVDGVIIRKGHASATFLPQVWEQLPSPDQFLSHLCMKAGLPANAWQDQELEVLTYQVQYFEEK
jgi:AmmeMemoRadiSam system protein B/AmmeMemoRadiSam system protein A